MGYVQANLMPNEQIVATGRIHWWAYISGISFTIIGLLLAAATGPLGAFFLVVGVVLLVKAWIHSFSTELVVTNKRVIAKFGFIKRSTTELLHSKVESFNVDQGIMGRILNFGTVIVNGTGGAHTPIPHIAAPLEFRRLALSTIEGEKG